MHVWIFVLSAMFGPVVEPLGISLDPPEPLPTVLVAEELTSQPMRYRGIERLFERLHANANANAE